MFCSLCLCTRYDAVQNRHATKFIAELFPDLTIVTNPILCQDCSSMLDQYCNVKKILEINKMTLKGKELNEQNFANLKNGESNISIEKPNCLLCSELIDRKVCKLETDYLTPPLDPDLDFEHKLTLCTNCELILRNLTSFKIRCYKILSKMQSFKNPLSLQKVENKDNLVSPLDGDCKVTKDVLSKNGRNYSIYPDTSYQKFSLNFKVYIIQQDRREVKPIKRSGVYLYTCPICQNMVTDIHKHFKLHNEMNAHILSKCVNCKYEGRSLKEMKLHICETSFLNEDENIYCCKICPFKSKQKGNLKTHMLIHKSIKEIPMYKCKQCKFRSRQKGNLHTHLLVHKPREEIKMHKCQLCIFQARQKGNLVTHILKKHKN